MTLEQIGTKLFKTKATISKYEKNEIIPDIYTLLELCNILNINLSQLIPSNETNLNNLIIQPFKTDKLYLYYYTNNILIKSIIEIWNEDNKYKLKFFNGVKNIEYYQNEFSYYYEGELIVSSTVGYMTFSNYPISNGPLEKVHITINIPWSNKKSLYQCFINALTPNLLPVIKKGILSYEPIEDFTLYIKYLKLTQGEIKKLETNNNWILENSNYDESLLY